MRFILLFTALVMTVLSAPSPAAAQESSETAFFESLPDVPVMPGLHENNEATYIYDTASGRVIEMRAIAESGLRKADVRGFYAATMPQLGWKAAQDGHFYRAGEALTITPEPASEDASTITAPERADFDIVFRLNPAPDEP